MAKTPDEIKKGLKLCLTNGACYICPYDDMTKDCDVCRPHLVADTEAYIQLLEDRCERLLRTAEILTDALKEYQRRNDDA